jgi:hypothetical protein
MYLSSAAAAARHKYFEPLKSLVATEPFSAYRSMYDLPTSSLKYLRRTASI